MRFFAPRATTLAASLMLALAQPMAGAPASPAPAQPPTGWTPCGELRDPQALWHCWAGTDGSHEGIRAAACVPKGNCPPADQAGRKVLNCTFEKSWQTGFRCILFCNYGGTYPWGSDGGQGCN